MIKTLRLSRRMPITCITFDLDDTLWACEPVILAAERAFYAWLAECYPRITAHFDPDELIGHRRRHFSSCPEMSHDFTYLRKRWLGFLADEWGYGRELVESGFRVFWEHRNAVTLFDAVPETLSRLKKRFAVGVITNGNADVEYIGIGHCFDFVITAAGAGSAKPAPGIFRAALDAAGVAAARSVHVGDDPTSDVRGAAAVGMRTVWVNANGERWSGGTPPDAEIPTLDALDAVLRQWS